MILFQTQHTTEISGLSVTCFTHDHTATVAASWVAFSSLAPLSTVAASSSFVWGGPPASVVVGPSAVASCIVVPFEAASSLDTLCLSGGRLVAAVAADVVATSQIVPSWNYTCSRSRIQPRASIPVMDLAVGTCSSFCCTVLA